MTLDRIEIARKLDEVSCLVRVVVAGAAGSAPRDAGAAMLVWADGQCGTIGGGALEYEAVARARALLAAGGSRAERLPLGPALGQCCGGSVVLVFERFDHETLANIPVDGAFLRRINGAEDMPMTLRRAQAKARAEGKPPTPEFRDGWLIEAVIEPGQPLWVWGAGHVGRALIGVLAPLPGYAISWIDTSAQRFPDLLPDEVTQLIATDPGRLVAHAPRDAQHLILTYSHALDLDLCHRLLGHGFAKVGLIGSATKWARFRSRLAALGHSAVAINQITCPIGQPALGKHPQAIAVGVAAELLRSAGATIQQKERAG